MNIATFLLRSAGSYGHRTAITVGEKDYFTYAEFGRRVGAIAGGLRNRMNFEPGERIALAMNNCPEYPEILFAIWHAGLCAVPINSRLHPQEFAFILKNVGAKSCFATPNLVSGVGSLVSHLPDLGSVILNNSKDYADLLNCDPIPIVDRSVGDIAWIFYTSGTTGRPKGAMLSHRNLLAMMLNYFADIDSVSPEDSILHAAPMSHGSGLRMLPYVAKAAKQVIPESGGFDPHEIFGLLAIHKNISFLVVPTMLSRLVRNPAFDKFDPTNIKTVVYSGAPMDPKLLQTAISRIGYKFIQCYGQGESPSTITVLSKKHHADTDHPRHKERLASVGIPCSVVDVRVGDFKGHFLPSGELGEVLVKGAVVMEGYWNDSKATAKTLRGGWLHTGDIGSLDEDGFLTLRGRSKDFIISGGSNIYPIEIEGTLLRHEGILDASVVSRPHSDLGEEVVAFVVPKERGVVLEEELDQLCLEHIARFKRPRTYRFVDALPKNSYGKVLKTELRERLLKEEDKI